MLTASKMLSISGMPRNRDIPNTRRFCDCGAKNDYNHILNCKRGEYVNYRHKNVRDSVVSIINTLNKYLRLVTKDMRIEPLLAAIESANFKQKSNNADKARLDIPERGVWSTFEGTFFRCSHFQFQIACISRNDHATALLSAREGEKEPVQEPSATIGEKVIFVPLVFTTITGQAFHKKNCCVDSHQDQ